MGVVMTTDPKGDGMQGFTHNGLRVTVSKTGAEIEATEAALRAWANRPGHVWPCSELAHLDSLYAAFDQGGLTEVVEIIDGIEIYGEDSAVTADEFNAFTSDALSAVMPANHPAYFVNVGQHLAD
jgi:hypothetical protein